VEIRFVILLEVFYNLVGKMNTQEISIPVPWGHIAGELHNHLLINTI